MRAIVEKRWCGKRQRRVHPRYDEVVVDVTIIELMMYWYEWTMNDWCITEQRCWVPYYVCLWIQGCLRNWHCRGLMAYNHTTYPKAACILELTSSRLALAMTWQLTQLPYPWGIVRVQQTGVMWMVHNTWCSVCLALKRKSQVLQLGHGWAVVRRFRTHAH